MSTPGPGPSLVCPCGSPDVDLRRGLLCGTCAAAVAEEAGGEVQVKFSSEEESRGEPTLDRVLAIIRNVDAWLDEEVSAGYEGQPLAQDWARVCKVAEETGEAIEALIACTGQNPRKGVCGTRDELLGELGDVAMTAMFAIQHFTKSETRTASVIMAALEKAAKRAAEAGYGD